MGVKNDIFLSENRVRMWKPGGTPPPRKGGVGGGGGICTHTSIIITYHMDLRIKVWEIFIISL